jgi:hypothetical protein
MPDAAAIIKHLSAVAEQGMSFSPFVRLLLVTIIVLSIIRKRLFVAFLAGYLGLALVAASVMAVAFENTQNLFIFFTLAPAGLLWGREALVLPPKPRLGAGRIALAAAVGLSGFFYPHFVKGITGAILFAPVGILPCPTLLVALAVIIAGKRGYTLYAVIATWALGAMYGAVGVFYLGVRADWALLAAVPVSIAAYFFATADEGQPRGKRFRRKRQSP